ncbi:MAG: DUF6468 domain-containing protein, partial [Alphaproteobacteria bacterium]
VYCTELNRRLKALHTDKDGLREVVGALDRATDRAQASISELKTLGAAAANDLKAERERADALLEELKLMIGSADRVANRLADLRGTPPNAEPRAVTVVKEPPSGDMFQALRQAR